MPISTTNIRKNLFGFFILLLFHPMLSVAAESLEEQINAEEQLFVLGEKFVITPSKYPQKVKDAPAAVTVITAEEIKQSGATNVPDILRLAAGLDIWEASGFNTNVGARGLTSLYVTRILVLVDGRTLYEDYMGDVRWKNEALFIENIKQIEILRTPGSALYGANAMTGIINIVTKSPRERRGFRGSVLSGERNTRQINAGYGVNYDKLSLSFMAGQDRSDGYGHATDKGQVFRDDYDILKGTLRADYAFTDTTSLTFDAGIADSDEYFPGIANRVPYGEPNSLKDYYFDLKLVTQPFSDGFLTIRGYQNARNYNYISTDPDNFKSTSMKDDTDTYYGEIQLDMQLPLNHLIIGGSNRRAYARSGMLEDSDKDYSVSVYGLYIQDEFKPAPDVAFILGLRYDRHSTYGTQASPRIAFIYHPWESTTLRFSYNRAFEDPNIYQLYGLVVPYPYAYTTGNEDLKPERIDSYEFGVIQALGGSFEFRTDLFWYRLTDRIDFVTTQYGSWGRPTIYSRENNDERVDGKGVEFEIKGGFVHWLPMFLNYSYQEVEYADSGINLDNIPFHKANLGITFKNFGEFSMPLEGLSGSLIAHYIGNREIDTRNAWGSVPDKLNDYISLDARLAYTVMNDRVELSIAAKNLFDKEHFESPFITQVGRTVTGKIDVRF